MGGHGALVSTLRNPGLYKSVSAFAPICNPIQGPWGQKALSGYLGEDKSKWADWDATELVKKYNGPPLTLLLDQVILFIISVLCTDLTGKCDPNKLFAFNTHLIAGSC